MKFKQKKGREISLDQHQGLQLHELMTQVNELQALQAELKSVLEKPLAEHLYVASYEKGILSLTADSASWATKIRFKAPELVNILKQKPLFSKLKKIKPLIQIEDTPRKKTPRAKSLSITKESSSLLKKTANMIKHPKLKQALERLAKN